MRAFAASRRKLGLDYVDLYLIHWPLPAAGPLRRDLAGLDRAAGTRLARAIGVSNFQPAHLRRIIDETGVTSRRVNQIELHPYLVQAELRAFDAEHGIATEAWSPLARGGELLTDPVVTGLAEKYGKTPAQVVIRWHLQLGNVVIPKSVTPARIARELRRLRLRTRPPTTSTRSPGWTATSAPARTPTTSTARDGLHSPAQADGPASGPGLLDRVDDLAEHVGDLEVLRREDPGDARLAQDGRRRPRG